MPICAQNTRYLIGAPSPTYCAAIGSDSTWPARPFILTTVGLSLRDARERSPRSHLHQTGRLMPRSVATPERPRPGGGTRSPGRTIYAMKMVNLLSYFA